MSEENLSRGERKRLEILQAAYDLFIEQGYHGTSMRQIAQRAHLALGGLYNHFSSKEELFRAVFLEYHPYREFFPALMAARGDTVEGFLKNAVERMAAAVAGRPGFLNLMFIEVVEFKNVHTRDLFIQLFPLGLQIVANLKQRGLEQLRPMPEPMIVRSFLGLFFGYFLTEIVFASVAPAEFSENAMDHFINIYLHGLLAAPLTAAG
jgi:AcrR family transcriptional regulator